MDTSQDVKALATVLQSIAIRLDGLREYVEKGSDWVDQWELVTPEDGGAPYRRGTPEVGQLLHRLEWAAGTLRDAARDIT